MRVILFIASVMFMVSCSQQEKINQIKVNNIQELQEAIKQSIPGDQLIMANGVWKDVQIDFYGKGTKEKPIVLIAEEKGKVTIEGASNLKIGGEYLEVNGLYFKNGFTPSNTIIQFKINDDTIANHCKVTQCVIEEFTQRDRDVSDHWVELWGRHNEFSHNYIAGKSNFGPTIRVYLAGNEHINNYHQIINNYFGPRPRKGGPHGETIQIGDSGTSMAPSYTNVSNNLFDRCNGEVEIISSKSNFNEFTHNVFFESEGSLVLRHGNYCKIDGNLFIGNEASNNIGGIRVINTGHWITNNYFYKIKGEAFRSALAVMNGIPKSPLNRYNQVTDVVVAYNSFIDCLSPWHFSVGSNVSQTDVLPPSEIRSARPKRVVVANNLIYNQAGDAYPIVNYDKVDGIKFENNITNTENKSEIKTKGLRTESVELNPLSDYLYAPISKITPVYQGFDFELIDKDLFGTVRTAENNSVGAIVGPVKESEMSFDRSKFGTNWFQAEGSKNEVKIFTASSSESLISILKEANSGDTILLDQAVYKMEMPLVIDKVISILSNHNEKSELIFSSERTAFEMHPGGNLTLKNLVLTGDKTQNTFMTLDKFMFKAYNLALENVEIKKFKSVLEVSKGSFADEISFVQTVIEDCERGLMLNKETNDGGDYNVEFLTVQNCKFNLIQETLLDYYRGGYDESTIGGNLIFQGNTVTHSGKSAKDQILIKNRGIVNVDLSHNTFENNPVKLIAVLWGEKGQVPVDNAISNSGKIEVVQNLKLKLMY
ncbi:chondroitinase-B domain-containing protein [Namhaeicola litoreus]|uniref:Chondroitinase-B domain-containing protein n=1 Tax=Namhaeicola litoreus TaxID=1052145 RepID=A0ABW3Y6F6_9FLAO